MIRTTNSRTKHIIITDINDEDNKFQADEDDEDDNHREEDDVLPLHDVEDGEDHPNDKEDGDDNANGTSGVRLHRRCGDDVPARKRDDILNIIAF